MQGEDGHRWVPRVVEGNWKKESGVRKQESGVGIGKRQSSFLDPDSCVLLHMTH
jgi:hypothetical protein